MSNRSILAKISDEELQAEIERRSAKAQMITPLANPDYTKLREFIVQSMEISFTTRNVDDDFAHYVYESAMQAVYGDGFFKWYNKQNFNG